ncbi:hypothetical protein SUGI_1015360 [Cryptomeria japonica]|nr:hypothetical protein SUGI_1015360 [Cryptomeria japonica]
MEYLGDMNASCSQEWGYYAPLPVAYAWPLLNQESENVVHLEKPNVPNLVQEIKQKLHTSKDPVKDFYPTPHSCGEPCGKPLDRRKTMSRCPHSCTLQCHPGPCPPCTAMAAPEPCPCGKKTIIRRFSDQNSVNALCFCGKEEKIMLCGDLEFHGEVDWKSEVENMPLWENTNAKSKEEMHGSCANLLRIAGKPHHPQRTTKKFCVKRGLGSTFMSYALWEKDEVWSTFLPGALP